MTSPTLFSSVCILLLLLCSAPETSAGVRPDPHPPLACAAHRWGVETASSAWAASAGLQVTSETRGERYQHHWATLMSVCHHPTRHSNHPDTPGKQPATCLLSPLHGPQSQKTSIYTLPPAAIPCLATSPKTTSGCATCPVSRAVGVKSDRVSEWLGWFTSLPTLLKRCQEGVFHRPLPLRLTPPDAVKRLVSKTVRALTDLDIYLARSSVFSLQIITIFMRTMENTSCFNGRCAYRECCFNALMIHLEHTANCISWCRTVLHPKCLALQRASDNARTKCLIFIAVSNTFKLSIKIKPNIFTAKMFQNY